MASGNKTNRSGISENEEEKVRLKAELQAMTEEKKAVFETMIDNLRNIRKKEKQKNWKHCRRSEEKK